MEYGKSFAHAITGQVGIGLNKISDPHERHFGTSSFHLDLLMVFDLSRKSFYPNSIRE